MDKKSKFIFDSKLDLEPGFAVVVLKDNKIVWQKCGGMADLGRKKPITPETNFRLASLSKQFTTMAIMLLKERGQLSYDDPLRKFIPDFPEYGKSITLRQLLTHTSGMPDHEKPLYKQIKLIPGFEPDIYDSLKILKKQKRLLFPSGTRYEYSDTGFVVLALIIEKISGLSYRNFLKNNIFKPLSMDNSDVLDRTKPNIRNRALGYKTRLPRATEDGSRNDSKNFEIFDYDPLNYIVGDEGVYSSISDMILWNSAWDSEKLVNIQSLQEAFKPTLLKNKTEGKAGFSWLIGNYQGENIIYQDGCWVGFRNIILKIPDKNLTVILLSNRTGLDSEEQRMSAAFVRAIEGR